MRPIPLANATRAMAAPPDWDEAKDGPCATLDIYDGADGFMRSAWVPTPDEIAWMIAGNPVILAIRGTAHPVVSLGVSPPPPAVKKTIIEP